MGDTSYMNIFKSKGRKICLQCAKRSCITDSRYPFFNYCNKILQRVSNFSKPHSNKSLEFEKFLMAFILERFQYFQSCDNSLYGQFCQACMVNVTVLVQDTTLLHTFGFSPWQGTF